MRRAGPGTLAGTAAELSRKAQLRAPRTHGKPVPLPSIAGSAMLCMAAASKDKTAAQTTLMVHLINTAFAVYEMDQQAGRTREARRIRSAVTEQLAPFTVTMPARTGAGATSAQGTAVPLNAAEIAQRATGYPRAGARAQIDRIR